MKHRCLSLLAAFAVLLSCFAPICADAAVADSTDIATWQELTAFAQSANAGNSYAGKTVRLTADITAPKDAVWDGVNGFAGTFDGQGHTLSGIFVNSDSTSGTGLFNTTASGAVILDLTIKNSTVTGAQRTGALVGNASGTLEMTNVRVADDVTVTSGARAGGLIGNADGNATVTLYNCACQASVAIAAVNGSSAGGYAGGLIGWVHYGASATMTGCLYAGSMSRTGGNYFGGMVGHIHGTDALRGSVTVQSSVAVPSLGGLSGQIGGFVGGSQAANYVDISLINSYSGYNTVVGSTASGCVADDSNYWTPSAAVNGDTRVIATTAQLYGFALASKSYNFSGRTLQLNKDMDLSGWGDWPMLGSASRPFAGTFNGAGYAVSGVSVSVDSADPTSGSYPAGFVAMLDGTLQNLTLRHSTITSNAVFVGGAVGRMRGSAQVKNVHVASDVLVRGYQQVGGVIGKYNGSADGAIVSTCWSEATVQLSPSNGALAAGGVVGVAQHPYSAISHCLFTGTVDAGLGVAGGILGDVMDGGVNSFATISDCCSAGTLTGSVTGGILGTFADQRSTVPTITAPTRSYSISNCCTVADKVVGALTRSFNRFDDDWTGNTEAYGDVSGLAARASHLLNNAYWAFPEDGVPALKAFSTTPDYEEISNKAALLAFAEAVNAGDSYAGKTVRLTADIASVGTWSGINGFAGTFDGAGHTISGLTVSSAEETGTGFFNTTVGDAVIRDLTVANSSITGAVRTGAVVGNASGTLEMTNVRVTDDVTVTSAARAGGLIGNADGNATVTLYNCASQASLSVDSVGGSSAAGFAGGLIGWVHYGASATMTGCLYAGSMSRTGGNYFGGMVGHIHGTEDKHGSVTVQSSVALPDLGGLSGEVGGFVGGAQSADYADISIINSYSGYDTVVGSSVSGRIVNDSPNYWTPSAAVNGNTRVIATTAQLYGFALASKSYHFSGRTLQLNKDMDLSNWGDWPMLGSASLPFAGTFNGGDHTLSGLYVSASSGSHSDETLRAGFVADLSGTVRNLTVSDSRFVSDAYFGGAVAGRVLGGTVQSVRVSDTVCVQAYNQAGGVAGSMNNGAAISNCLCQARVVQTGTGDVPGGIVSTVRQTGNTIAHCLFSGSIRGASSIGYAGGIAGWVAGSAGVTVSDCVSTGTYTGASNYGGAIGSASGSYTINSSYVSHTTKYVGSANPGSATGSAYYPSAWQLKGTGVCANLDSAYWTLAADKLPVLKSFSDVPSIEETPMMSRESIAGVPAASAAYAVNYTIDGRFELGIYGRHYYYGTTGAYSKYTAYLSELKTAGFTLYEGGDVCSTTKDNIYTAVLVKGSICAVVSAWEISDNAQIHVTIRPITDGKIWNGEELFAGVNTQGWSASAVDYGGDTYVKTFTGKTLNQYNTLCSGLVSGGYTLVAGNGSGLYGKVYTRSYQKGDLTLTATYSIGKGEIRLSATRGEALSPHLNDQATWAADNMRYESTLLIRPAMTAEGVEGENSFIIRLKNGHFLVNDGGVPNEAINVVETLEHLTPKGQIPVVEGWFVSHSHMDHVGVLYQLYRNPALCQRIRVDGVYFSDPNLMTYGLSAEPSVQRDALYVLCADQLKTSGGSATPVYRNYTGERYYFSDISVDIIMSQEQIPLSEYSGDLNDSSTWICLNIDGDKVLLGGDGDLGGKARILTYYSTADMTVTMRSSLHHGSNEAIEFIDHCPTTTILYACTPGHWDGTSSASANQYLYSKSQEQIYQDVETVYTFPYTVGSYAEPVDISAYRSGAYTAPSASGKVFAGWYWDPTYDVPVSKTVTEGYAFAKFADADVLTVKTQRDLKEYSDGKRKLRIVTSVDSMDYKEVGFILTYHNSAGAEKTVKASSTVVYQSLQGYINETTQETYLPTAFSPESIRFCAFKLVASSSLVNSNLSGIAAQPYWITADGTTVYGATSTGLKFVPSGLQDATGWDPDFLLGD